MSDNESSHSVPKPTEKFHDAKKRTDTELKTLSKTAKGKQGKDLIAAKEREIEEMLAKLKLHWDLYNRGENGEDVSAEYAAFSNAGPEVAEQPQEAENDGKPNMMMEQRELTKDQKKRLERERREAEQERRTQEVIKSLPDQCKEELKKIQNKLKKYKFTGSYAQLPTPAIGGEVVEVTGDGHCLFRAINQQLEELAKVSKNNGDLYATWISRLPTTFLSALKSTYKITLDDHVKEFSIDMLRKMAACWIRLHPDHFVPFLIDHEVFLSGGDVDTYCAALVNHQQVLWGGDPELAAFAALFDTPLIVFQAKGENPIYNAKVQRDDGVGAIIVTFHQFWTTAGAHYNGVAPIKKEEVFQ